MKEQPEVEILINRSFLDEETMMLYLNSNNNAIEVSIFSLPYQNVDESKGEIISIIGSEEWTLVGISPEVDYVAG